MTSLSSVLSFEAGRWWLLSFLAASLLQFVLLITHSLLKPEKSAVKKWRLFYLPVTVSQALLWALAINYLLTQPVTDTMTFSLVIILLALLISVLHLCIDALISTLYLSPLIIVPLELSYGKVPSDQLFWFLSASFMLLLLITAFWGFAFRQRNLLLTANRCLLKDRLAELESEVVHLSEELSAQDGQTEEVERELSVTKEAAESANMAKTEFLATMSHEIRTPLNGILPTMEMLRETQLNTEQRQLVNTALNSSQLLLGIINDILDFSKVEAGKLELESIEIDVRDLIESVTMLMKHAADRRGLRINYLIAPDVPSRVRGDPIRLRQILANLVSNAIKFTEKGGISVEVSRRNASRTEVELMFAVQDTGSGMSPEVTQRLFTAFSQADASTTRTHGGSGLGLAICKRLTELMNGRIGVKSIEGKGSVFWFVIPLRKSLEESPSLRYDLQSIRALVVAYENENYEIIKNNLNDWGVLHERAETAQEALTKLNSSANLGESWAYEVIILDGTLVGAGVSQLLREVRRVPTSQRIKCLVFDSISHAKNLTNHINVELLESPVKSAELLSKLNRMFDVEEMMVQKEVTDDLAVALSMPDQEHSWDDIQKSNNTYPKHFELSRAGSVFQLPSLNGHVMVVEDNPINLAVVDKILGKLGIQTTNAVDGQIALEAFKNSDFDLILMDCQMPKLDGYAATKAIREWEKRHKLARTPIIAMTANAMAGDREKCLDSGMDDYLAKPVKPAGIRSMMKQWLSVDKTIATFEQNHLSDKRRRVSVVKDAPPIIDAAIINELFDIMEEQTTTLIKSFLVNSLPLVDAIEEASEQMDLEKLINPAHSLKSSSANVGAMALSAVARRIEHKSRKGTTKGIQQECQKLLQLYDETTEQLTALCQQSV
ncbi:MAG: ATP-binding protein [Candidatus Polarisedimenticolaceae bacterium]|nr:ATP-binding protein [Candidatus Polarisedimenticolaceae bacterium]